MRGIIKTAVITLLVLSLGLHWALLQTVAWTGMLFAYSSGTSFRQAMVQTFDGKHPCPLCKIIKQGRAEEQKRQQERQIDPTFKLDLGLFPASTELVNQCVFPEIPAEASCFTPRANPPLTPPPRLLFPPAVA